MQGIKIGNETMVSPYIGGRQLDGIRDQANNDTSTMCKYIHAFNGDITKNKEKRD